MTEPPSPFLLHPFGLVWVVWCVGPLGTAMRVRVLHAKLYALPGSTARQLFISSTLLDSSTARQLLDRPRQTSTKLDAPAHGVSLDRLDKARQARPRQQARQRLDGASTARQLDSQGSTRAAATRRRPPRRAQRARAFRRERYAAHRRSGPGPHARARRRPPRQHRSLRGRARSRSAAAGSGAVHRFFTFLDFHVPRD